MLSSLSICLSGLLNYLPIYDLPVNLSSIRSYMLSSLSICLSVRLIIAYLSTTYVFIFYSVFIFYCYLLSSLPVWLIITYLSITYLFIRSYMLSLLSGVICFLPYPSFRLAYLIIYLSMTYLPI